MINKLKQKSGETLIETLFSMLIAVLSMGILCTAVMAASNINAQSRELDEQYQDELNAVESLDDTVKGQVANVIIRFEPENGVPDYQENVTVTMYGDSDSAFISYDYNKGDAP